MGINECLPLKDPKDLSFYDSDVIIEIVRRDYLYENEHIGKDDAKGSTPLSDDGNIHVNHRVINGDKILPFPMDTYSRRDREKTKQNQKNNCNMNTHGEALDQNTLACGKIKHNYQSSYSEETVQLMGSNEMGKQQEMEVAGLVDINIQEDPEKLKRRIERFELPLTMLKNAAADKSVETETNTLLLQPGVTVYSDFKDQRPTRRRKWTSS